MIAHGPPIGLELAFCERNLIEATSPELERHWSCQIISRLVLLVTLAWFLWLNGSTPVLTSVLSSHVPEITAVISGTWDFVHRKLTPGQLDELALLAARNRETLEMLYDRAREELFPQMLQDRQAQITAQFEAFLERPEHFAVMPVLVHGSFGPETILYAASEHRISGVIDFSRACLGDPALDFARLVGPTGYGETFLERLVPLYPDLPALLERAQFYATVVALEEEWRKRRKQEQPGLMITPPPEIERIFIEGPKLNAGEDETPIGGYFY